jgi:hypothetical protein
MIELRIDPWDPEYGASPLAEAEAADDLAGVRLDVEPGADWDVPRPAPPAPPGTPALAFIDGVRRAELRLTARRAGPGPDLAGPAVAGTLAVGAVLAGPGGVRLCDEADIEVARLLVVGGTLGEDAAGMAEVPPLTVPCGRALLIFEPAGRDGEPDELGALQAAMRRAEARLADRLLAGGAHDLVVMDGPLSFGTRPPALGLVKRAMRAYLPPERAGILARLGVGERTPLFRIRGPERWTWYLRLARPRRVEGHMAGVVRLEVSAGCDLAAARRLADLAGALLPRFASDRMRDPRAPQNLYPVGELERQLHRRLGDRALVRRSLEVEIDRRMEATHA